MKKREYRDYLNDIVECINDVKSFIDGVTNKEFSLDKKTINAVVRSIEIVGEAGTLRLSGVQGVGARRADTLVNHGV